ncbi:MAG: hypothetical protein JWO06_2367 [Bacteroidota bacterium]|nr:hypothetical protein [Bacteroidota bacterium]
MKIIKTILLLGVAITGLTANGQTFIKAFSIDSSSTLAYSLNARDSFFFVAGNVNDPVVSGHLASFLAKFDYSGSRTWDTVLRADSFSFFVVSENQNSLVTTKDKGLASAGKVTTLSGKDMVLFTKFDSTGNLSFYKTYDLGMSGYLRLYSYSLIEYDNAYYIFGGIQLANFTTLTVVLKVDANGNQLFARTYAGLPELYGTLGSVCLLPNSHFLLTVGRTDDNINYWQAVYKTCFLEIDTLGTLINEHCTTDSNTFAQYSISPTVDGNYLSCGSFCSYRHQGGGPYYNEYIAKWDTGFNRVWDLKAGDVNDLNTFEDFYQDSADNIVICGFNIDSITGYDGVIAKADSNGNLTFYRKYKMPTGLFPDYSWNYFNDLTLLPEGDILAVGSWEANNGNPFAFPQLGLIIRVHSDGCMDDGSCGITDVNEPLPTQPSQARTPIQIFPNPSNGSFVVNTLYDLPAFTEIEIYDAWGRKIRSQQLFGKATLLNLTNQPPGIYFYQIVNGLNKIANGSLVIVK